MSNEGNSNLNVILGQLEDELCAIMSAREQTDSVISATSELSAKLERVVIETRKLVEESNSQTRKATELLAGEVRGMSDQSEAITKAAADGVEAIKGQASAAQIELTRTADDVVGGALSRVSELAEEVISNLNENVVDVKNELSATLESTKTAALNIEASGSALMKANELAAAENKNQNEATRALLVETQNHLDDIDASVATLKGVDIASLIDEIGELKTVEANNAAALKGKLMTAMVLAGASVVLCVGILVKLFVG